MSLSCSNVAFVSLYKLKAQNIKNNDTVKNMDINNKYQIIHRFCSDSLHYQLLNVMDVYMYVFPRSGAALSAVYIKVSSILKLLFLSKVKR